MRSRRRPWTTGRSWWVFFLCPQLFSFFFFFLSSEQASKVFVCCRQDAGHLGRGPAGVCPEGREGESWLEAVDRWRPATRGERTEGRGRGGNDPMVFDRKSDPNSVTPVRSHKDSQRYWMYWSTSQPSIITSDYRRNNKQENVSLSGANRCELSPDCVRRTLVC